jgi:hypothetical protein
MHPVVIAVYLRSNPQRHSDSGIGVRLTVVIARFSIMLVGRMRSSREIERPNPGSTDPDEPEVGFGDSQPVSR